MLFIFLLVAMVVVVAAVTLAVVGGGDRAVLPESAPEQLVDPLPETRPVGRSDVEALRLPVSVRGYRMGDVDDVLSRLGAELAERDARIAELESALAGAQATAVSSENLFGDAGATGGARGGGESGGFRGFDEPGGAGGPRGAGGFRGADGPDETGR